MNTAKTIKLRRDLLAWYDRHARRLPWRETSDPYAIWVSEVMLQQTQVKTVRRYYASFMRAFPDVQRLAQADLQDVLKQWEGLGYYARARNLHRAARRIVADHHGALPSGRTALQQLPGIGDYIAAAVLSIAFDQPYPVVDGNVKRVLARVFAITAPVNQSASFKRFYAQAAELLDPQQPGDFNQAMMELGALVCTPKQPTCSACPLMFTCRAYAAREVARYPRKRKARPVPTSRLAIGVVLHKDRMLITQRPADGLLGGLWEFPGGEIKRGEQPAQACVRVLRQAVGLTVATERHLTRVTHAYTHFKIIADVFICTYGQGEVALAQAVDHRWIKLQHLDRYPFPKANHKFFKALRTAVGN